MFETFMTISTMNTKKSGTNGILSYRTKRGITWFTKETERAFIPL